MRKLFTVLMVIGLGIFNNLNAQQIRDVEKMEVVGEIKIGMLRPARLSYSTELDSYFLTYQDENYQQITSIHTVVLGDKESVLNIKNALLDLIDTKENGKTITVDLQDNCRINFSTLVSYGAVSIKGNIYDGYVNRELVWLTKKRINKLFNL